MSDFDINREGLHDTEPELIADTPIRTVDTGATCGRIVWTRLDSVDSFTAYSTRNRYLGTWRNMADALAAIEMA